MVRPGRAFFNFASAEFCTPQNPEQESREFWDALNPTPQALNPLKPKPYLGFCVKGLEFGGFGRWVLQLQVFKLKAFGGQVQGYRV